VADFPNSDLTVNVIRHPRSETYRVEGRLRLPGQTLVSGVQDADIDSAFQRSVRELLRQVDAYKEGRDGKAEGQSRRREALDHIVAPEAPTDGALGRAVAAGDYRAFRLALAGYEEWLRNRVGRWIQRYPKAEARVGKRLRIGDVLEQVYLSAFEQFAQWSPAVRPLHDWLDGLIDASLKVLLRHPDEASENASLARTLRDMPR
jgi:hypothetical protein